MTENELAKIAVDVGYHVHLELGPGLLESVYSVVMAYELRERGLHVVRESPVPIRYKTLVFDEGFRADLIVEGKLIIELKSLESLHRVHRKQLLTHLKLTGIKLGLLMNFGEALFKDGVSRVVNGLDVDEP